MIPESLGSSLHITVSEYLTCSVKLEKIVPQNFSVNK